MKIKISKLLGIGLTVALLASLFAFATPASARTLGWSTEVIPSGANEVIEQTNVVDIAVGEDGSTVYAASGGVNLYKSTNRGVTWSVITAPANTNLLAIAPDDNSMLVFVDTGTNTVYVTTNGGNTFGSMGIPGAAAADPITTINAVAISAESAGVHYVAVAGIDTGAAAVWKYNIGAAAPAWAKISTFTGFGAGSESAAALAYSPNFISDQVLAVVTADWSGATDNISLELYSENSDQWNTNAGFSSYPATITSDTGITGITSASIALDPDYLGSDDAMRLAFIGLTVAGSATKSGIHRMDDVLPKELKAGTTLDINDVAYDGVTLICGELSSNICYYCDDPTAGSPTVSTTRSLKRPGNDNGSTGVVLTWAGTDIVAGVSGKGAFSVSHNSGKSYNDISLIDNLMTDLTDVALNPDGTKSYLISDDNTDISVWRKASAWERILTVQPTVAPVAPNEFIVRIAPDDPDVIYVAQKGSTSIYYTSDAGEERWQIRACNVNIEDIAVETDGDVVYALTSGGRVAKSANAGFTWSPPGGEDTLLTSGNTIVSVGEGKVLVGDTTGFVSYSTDSGDTWTKIVKQIGDTAAEVVLLATDLADEGFIYAALESANTGIYRWQVGVSEAWTAIKSSTATNDKAYGIAMQEGALYVLTSDGTDSNVYRSLSPHIPKELISWATMPATGAVLDVEPQALKISSGSAKLWAIDCSTAAVYSYSDTLLGVSPALIGPTDGFADVMNLITGYPTDIMFTWQKPSDEVSWYDLWVALDPAFDECIRGPGSAAIFGPAPVVSYNFVGSNFMPGNTYYWKVRVAGTGPIHSSWSEVRSFTIEEATVTPPVVIEDRPPEEITVEVPDVIVNVPPTVEVPAAQTITPVWIYLIIVIGAILVIAVIILIVRTRRAV